eukprot:jgi/Chlat1/2485/Chrsp175S02357
MFRELFFLHLWEEESEALGGGGGSSGDAGGGSGGGGDMKGGRVALSHERSTVDSSSVVPLPLSEVIGVAGPGHTTPDPAAAHVVDNAGNPRANLNKAALANATETRNIKDIRCLPLRTLLRDINFQVYCLMHVAALLTPFLWRPTLPRAALLLITYNLRMFGITGGYHRLLAHKSYETSRAFGFFLAWLGASAMQKGPLWWCSHHRHHHRNADNERDAHSPMHTGFFWSHMGWFLCTPAHVEPLWSSVPDLLLRSELLWLERCHFVPPLALALALWGAGGGAALAWGFALATVVCWHATYCINSVAHVVGTRRYRCEFSGGCDARNNGLLAVITLGEGWHNNHHCYMRSARHGFYFWEFDATYCVLRALALAGLVWDLHLPPMEQLEERREGPDQYICRCHEQDSLTERIVHRKKCEANSKVC